jgi:hypothetical protein
MLFKTLCLSRHCASPRRRRAALSLRRGELGSSRQPLTRGSDRLLHATVVERTALLGLRGRKYISTQLAETKRMLKHR